MKYSIYIFAILGLFSCNNQKEKEIPKTIILDAEGEITYKPDMTSFNIDIECNDKDINKAKECAVSKSNEIYEKLLSYDIKKENISTSDINLAKDYVYNRITGEEDFNGYRININYEIKLFDFTNIQDIYTDLIDEKNIILGSLNYSHSKLDSIKKEAYTLALENGNLLADKILSELPEKNIEVFAVGNVSFSPFSSHYSATNVMKVWGGRSGGLTAGLQSGLQILQGEKTISASLRIQYLIK